MKKLPYILTLILTLIVSISFTSCDDDDNVVEIPQIKTIADFVVANNGNYSSLLAALQKADLVDTLNGDENFTVFAPNNAAFDTFLSNAGFSSLDDVPVDVLTQILLNHVVAGNVQSGDLATGYISSLSTATPNGANMSMYIDLTDGVKINGTAKVTTADNVVENGVIHLVDAVIGIPTIVTMATSNSSFSNLVAALTRDDQPDFVSVLSTANGTDPAPFTVFAPTDAAFSNLLTELGAASLADIDGATLTATLNHHVVGGANVTAEMLSDNMTVTTLGGDITANISGGATLTDANGRISNIVATNVQTANGVIHVIDKVVLPMLEQPTNTIADFVVANMDNYSSLLAALQKADLVETLSGDDMFTVFAPNNDAFAAFLTSVGFNSLDDVPVDVLTQILLNHVVAGSVQSSDLATGYISSLSTATPNGANMSMYIDLTDGVKINGGANVTAPDNNVDNGVIHLVDAVIGLPTIVTMATSNSSFTNLVAALTRDDQPDFVSVLSTANGTDPAPFTVFAPTDAAFSNLLTELGAASLADIDGATLTATLNHHVVGGANVTAEMLSDNMTVTTLGGDITANISGGATLTDANGRMSNIVATNVQTANGVIHVIDKVVLPMLEQPTNTIADFVVANMDNYSSLLAALQKADLVETLSGDDMFTVFAPNNDAFAAFLTSAGFNSLDDVPVDVLTQILLNHVVAGNVQSGDLATGYISSLSTATPNGANMSMYIDLSDGVKINGGAKVTAPDNNVDNGVIHLVDAVIGLPTIVTMATSNSSFTNLVAALTRDDQPDFVSVLSTANGTDPAPFTVFAPTDAAFSNLLTELGAASLADIDGATLTATLNHHVVGGANVTAEMLSDNMTVTTLGGDITANISGGATLTDANGRVSNIVATNVQTANGVIHVIDKVVLPNLN